MPSCSLEYLFSINSFHEKKIMHLKVCTYNKEQRIFLALLHQHFFLLTTTMDISKESNCVNCMSLT